MTGHIQASAVVRVADFNASASVHRLTLPPEWEGEYDITPGLDYVTLPIAGYIATKDIRVRPLKTNVIEGSFTTPNTTGIYDIQLHALDGAYPVIACVVPDSGWATSRWVSGSANAVGMWFMCKTVFLTAPSYVSTTTPKRINEASTTAVCRAANRDEYVTNTNMETTSYFIMGAEESDDGSSCIRFKGKNTMSYYVGAAGHGLVPNLTYRYCVIYY